MNREDVFCWVKSTYKVEPDYPWFDGNAVLRHIDNRKWFGVIINVPSDKLGLKNTGRVDVLNVKCDPLLIDSLRQEQGFFPAYHMNKNSWISILLDINTDEDKVKMLLDMSYDLTKKEAAMKKGI